MLIFLGLLIIGYILLSYQANAPVQYLMDGVYLHLSSSWQLIFSILKIFLGFIPWLGWLILGTIILVKLVDSIKFNFKPIKFLPSSNSFWFKATLVVLIMGFIEFSLTNYFVLDHMPHTPDAVAYTQQAKLFASGRFYLEMGPESENFALLGMVPFHQKQFAQYSFGHPLLLSLGYLINLPWLVPPILGTLSLGLIYLIGTQIYSKRIGFLVTFLSFTSPFIKMNSVNFMSHNTALFFGLLGVFLFIKLLKTKNNGYSFLTGIVFGFLVNVRPFTGFLFSLPVGLFAIVGFIKDLSHWKKNLQLFGAGFLGLILMAGCYLAYNRILSGSYNISGYNLGYIAHFGIDNTRSLAMALADFYANLILLNKVLLGWPAGLSFLFVAIYFLRPIKNNWEYLFIGIIVSLLTGYFFYQGSWMIYGPRFWYETTPFWLFIIVAGLEKFPVFIKSLFPGLFQKNLDFKNQLIIWLGYFGIFLLCLNSLWHWFQFKQPSRWYNDNTPENIGEMKNFNFVNKNLINQINGLNLKSALVFVKPGGNWGENYGVPSYQMDLSFKDKVIYALDLGNEKNFKLMKLFPERTYFKADYELNQLKPYYLNP